MNSPLTNCGRDWKDERAIPKLKAYILRKLGCDVIGVELSDEQLDDAIRDAEEYWMQWVGRVRSVDLTLSTATEYADTLIGPDVNSVVDVFFDAYRADLRDVYGWADVEINPFQYMFEGRHGYSGVVQYQQYRETARKIISADKDWIWDKSRRMLVISPIPEAGVKIKVVYMSRCFDYLYLNTYEWTNFREYAYCKAMRTLAHIRMKFPEKPSAMGTFSMDGESMWANAETIEMGIEEKMRSMQHPVGIITG